MVSTTDDRRVPTFLIIGAAKSGTTSLYYYLSQHPDVYTSPVKELRFFAYEEGIPPLDGPGDRESNQILITEWEQYLEAFAGASDEQEVGEASPIYLYDPEVPRRIHTHLPEVRLIAILRNPVDRAYSHFNHLIKDDREPLRDFRRALEQEDRRIEAGWEWSWHYRKLGYYFEQLSRYEEYFDRDQIAVYLFEDLVEDNVGFAQEIYRWLGIDDSFVPDVSPQFRKTGVPRSNRFQRLLFNPDNPLRRLSRYVLPERTRERWLAILKSMNLKKPPLSEDVRSELSAVYREDIEQLQEYLDRDLSHWLE